MRFAARPSCQPKQHEQVRLNPGTTRLRTHSGSAPVGEKVKGMIPPEPGRQHSCAGMSSGVPLLQDALFERLLMGEPNLYKAGA